MSDESYPPVVSVSYDRKFSDGNFGSEGLSMSISQPFDHVDVTSDEMAKLAEWLRHNVLTRLATSRARMVALSAREELGLPPARVESKELEDISF